MRFLSFFVCINGLSIMAIEMAASRYLAPYFGSSTIVWANIIGVIMGALAIGYFLGGKLADRFPEKHAFYISALVGSVVVAFIPLLVDAAVLPIAGNVLHVPFWEVVGSFLVAVFFFGIPIAFLAVLSPYSVRIANSEVAHVGSITGKLYAWGTIGSVLGVYVSTFLTIPYFGVRETIWGCAFMLFLLASIGIGFSYVKKYVSVALLLFVGAIGTSLFVRSAHATLVQKVLVDKETLYQYVRVIENSEGARYMIFNEGGGIQSVYNPHKILTGFYYDYYPLFQYDKALVAKKELSVLVIGYAGGTIGKLFHTMTASGTRLHIDGVEIDGEVSSLSKQYMGVREDERILYTQDGRSFLQEHKEKQYDIIIVDAYTREQYIPPHLITKEFFQEISQHLNGEGMLLLNINAQHKDSPLLHATVATIQSALPAVDVYSVADSYNYIIRAGQNLQQWDVTGLSQNFAELVQKIQVAHTPLAALGSVPIFTDNKNNVEQLTNADIWAVLAKLSKN